MSNMPVLKMRATDNNGDVLPGALMYFYAAGTTTPQNTYTTSARTVAHANPVVADSDGYFPLIYLDPSLAYKVVFNDADDVLIWTADNFYATALGTSDLTTRIISGGASPTDYGAVGDGAADESDEVQDAIDGASCVVDLLGKTFRCDYSLTLRSDIEIINGTFDFSNSADDEYIKCEGVLGAAVAVGGNVTAGDTTITVSPTGLVAGDVVLLKSSTGWRGGASNNGELATIKSTGAGTIDVVVPARDGYTTAASASITKITPVENVRFRNVTILASKTASGTGVPMFFDLCRHITFEDCHFQGIKKASARIHSSIGVSFVRCTFEDGYTNSFGIEVAECCEAVTVEDCTFDRVYTEVDVGGNGTRNGVCRDITVVNSRFIGCTGNAIASHMLVENLLIAGNDIESHDIAAILLASSARCNLIGNKVRATGAQALSVTGVVDGVVLSGNLFTRVDTAGPCAQFAGTAADNISGVIAVGNRFAGGTYGLYGSNVLNGTFARFGNIFTGQATGETTGLGTNNIYDLTITGLTASCAVVTTAANTLASASGLPATLDGSSLVVQDPAHATAIPTADSIVKSGGSGTIDAGWLPDISGTYATAAKGVTNGDSHDHSGGDGAQILHSSLSGAGVNAHTTIDAYIATPTLVRPSLNAYWTNGTGDNAVGYWKGHDNVVHLMGKATFATGGSSSLFTLPVGCRANTARYFTIVTSSENPVEHATIYLNSGQNVEIMGGAEDGKTYALDGISFWAEA